MTLDEFRVQVDGIRAAGSLREPYGLLLYSLVRYMQPRAIVEVGTWRGYSAAWLARGLQDNGDAGHLYAIDNWSLMGQRIEDTQRNLTACGLHNVTLLSGDSLALEWPDHDLAFIDGNHSLDHCAREIATADRHGATTIVVHDTTAWWGPRQWLDRVRQSTGATWDVLELPAAEGLTICTRRTPKPPAQFGEAQYPAGAMVDR